MVRILPLTVLLFAATAAGAAEPPVAESETSACAKAAAEAEQPAGKKAGKAESNPGTTAPVRPRGGAAGKAFPRWNSLLPGMIR